MNSGLLLSAVAAVAAITAPRTPPASDWPMYRRDDGLTGVSPLRGGFAVAPGTGWSVDLGGPMTALEQARFDDFDGDGAPELLRILPNRMVCQSAEGEILWETDGLSAPTVVDIRDFAGDGSRGILLTHRTDSGLELSIVCGRTGHRAALMPMYDCFGQSWRAGKLLPGVQGQQLSYWWSGAAPGAAHGGPETHGHGYLWSFEDGLERPRLRFEAHPGGVIYAPLHLFADMDGDGRAEMVMISHEQAWVYDLQTAQQRAHMTWGQQIRTYWATVAAIPLRPGELPTLVMINPHQPGLKAVSQDRTSASVLWKAIVGPIEDQYQAHVKIGPGAPDPVVDLDGDGRMEVMATVTNEHGDRLPHLVIFSADSGARLLDEVNLTVLTADDLDGDSKPELLIRDGSRLRVATFEGERLVDRWCGEDAEPLLRPAPPEGSLDRTGPYGASCYNRPLWREAEGSKSFLMRIEGEVWACRMVPGGGLENQRLLADHEALRGPADWSGARGSPAWDGRRLTIESAGEHRITYALPQKRAYLAFPPVVGELDGQRRVLVIDGAGALLSLAPTGVGARTLISGAVVSGSGPSICDTDADGNNEVVTLASDASGRTCLYVLAPDGRVKHCIEPPPICYAPCLGPTGRLGEGRGRWAVVRYQRDLAETAWIVVAYDLQTGKELWTREHYGSWGRQMTQFLTFFPTSVYDYNGDGADDLVFISGSFYGLISVRDNRELVGIRDHCSLVPGHWSNYGNISLTPLEPGGPPRLVFSKEYALALVTDLEGNPVWHWGMTRDTTSASMVGLGDLDGDGRIEPVLAQPDGLLRCFDSAPTAQKCPTCPPEEPLSELNHGALQRWTFTLPPPVSDLTAADLDGDGRHELLCGAGDGRLYAIGERDGACAVLWSVELGDVVGSPVIADLDDDAQGEVLVPTQDGRLHSLRVR